MSNHKRPNVALIGAGGRGRQHARIFQSSEDVDFCAIAGRNPKQRRNVLCFRQ